MPALQRIWSARCPLCTFAYQDPWNANAGVAGQKLFEHLVQTHGLSHDDARGVVG